MTERGRNDRDRARTVAVGLRVRQLRLEAGLTQEELAERAGLHRATVGFVERAERESGVSQVWRLADGLGTTIDALLAGVDDDTGPDPLSDPAD